MGEPITTTMHASLPDLAPPLLPTEQVGPKGWIRTMLLFKLADDYDMGQLAGILQTAFRKFKSRTPVAGCEAVPLEGAKQVGLLKFRYYGDEISDFVIKDLRQEGQFPAFQELESRGFPTSVMDVETLCLRGTTGEWPKPGDRLNVIMMQANFIRGGLILNTLIMHAYADGTTAYKFTEILGEEVRRAQNLPIDHPVEIPFEDRAKLMKAYPTSSTLGQPENHPEYIELPFTPTGLPPKLMQPNHIGHIFYFSPAKINALKALAAPTNAKLFKDEPAVPFVSTNDVITALIWRSLMAAQHPDLLKHGSGSKSESESTKPVAAGPSIVGVALDARRRASVPVHKYTIGNILGFAPAALDIPTLLNEASLADIAAVIRKAVAKTEKSYLDSVTTWVDRLQDVNRLTPTMFLDMPGSHILMSSWAEFPYYDIEWGPALGDRIRSVRFPACGVCHAFQIRLPDNPAKPGVEMFVCGFDSDIDRLLADPLWTEFAGKPVDN